jgi:hypothetical protein
LVSRSRIKHVNEEARSSRSIATLRATWVTHAPAGGMSGDTEEVNPSGAEFELAM